MIRIACRALLIGAKVIRCVGVLVLAVLCAPSGARAQTDRIEYWGWGSFKSSAPGPACENTCAIYGGIKYIHRYAVSCGRWQYKCKCNNIPGEFLVGPWCKTGYNISAYRCGKWRCATLQEIGDEGLTTQSLDCNQCDRNECTVGNPTYPSSGEKSEEAVDFQTEGSTSLQLRRILTSGVGAISVEPTLGRSWRFSFDTDLAKTSTTVISVQQARGNEYRFNKQSDGSWLLNSNTSADVKLAGFTTPVEAYQFTDEEDTVQRFESVAGAFRLIWIMHRGGYQQTLTRDTDGKITAVTDNLGRSLTFTWLNSVVTRISAPGGINIDYTYEYKDFDPASQPIVESRVVKTVTVSASSGSTETTTYHYENTSWPYALTGITDGRGTRFATFTYDNVSGRVTATEHSGGADRHTFSYPSANQTTVVNPLGKSATYNYTTINLASRLTSLQGAASANCPASGKSMTYNTLGRLTQTTDEEGRVTSYVLNSRGLPTSVTRGYGTAQATTTSYTYHATLRVPAQIAEPGLTSDLTWDSNGRLTNVSQADTTTTTVPYSTNGTTRAWTFAYTGAAGLLTSVDGPLAGTGDTVTYAYNASGYLASVTNEVGHVTTVNTVNGRGQPTQITDANGVVTNLTYDNQGRLKSITVNPGAGQAVTSIDYDAIGQVTRVTRPDSSYFDYVYSDAKRLTSATAQNGEKIEYTRDLMGNVTATVFKSAASTIVFNQTKTFDELGRLLRSIGAYSQTSIFGYDKTSNVTSVTDPRSKVYSNAYDSVNRLIRETDPESSQVNYTLDTRGVTTAYSDPRSLATTYVYNGFREVIQEASPDRGTIVYVRDARGLVTQVTDGRGIVTNMTYDNAGRLLTKTYPAATAENITYTYDSVASGNKGVGRLTKVQDESGSTELTYDERGNVVTDVRTIAGQVHTIAYVYDLADRITQITYPSGRIVNYVRDSQGRVTSVTTKLNAGASPVTVASAIAYQPLSGLVNALSYGNGLSELNTFTLDYELSVLGVYDGATGVINRTHTRSDNLNLTGITDAVTAGNSQSFAMSNANRLQSASGSWGDKSLSYDGVGNRTQESTTLSGSTVTDTYAYPGSSNRLTTVTRGMTTIRAFTYDGGGNILSDSRAGTSYDYTYNNRNRLATVTVGGSLRGTYTYNGLEQVAIRVMSNQTPSGTVHSLYDRGGNLLAETDGSGATGTTREYIWLLDAEVAPTFASRTKIDRPIAVVANVSTSPALYWVHVDHLHRPIKMTDAAKLSAWDATWKPWGEPDSINGSVSVEARLPGQWFQIEAGLHYNWHRHYDPSIGRYTQPDPLGFVDGPSVYAYAVSLPLTGVDPNGLLSLPQSPGPTQGLPADQCGIKDFIEACKEELKRAGKNAKKNWQGIALACMAYFANKQLPPPPPPPRKPPIERPGPPPPPPAPPPKDPPKLTE
jgi:RHS repeat-associated protein